MTDELDRIRDYVSSLPPARSEDLAAARSDLDDVMTHEIAADPRAPVPSRRWHREADLPPSLRRGRKPILVLGFAALVTVAVVVPLVVGHPAPSGRPVAKGDAPSSLLVRLVADDVNVTVASGNYDMTYADTTTPPTNCPAQIGGAGQAGGGTGATPQVFCGDSSLSDITGHGTVDTNPYAMVTIGQVGPLGTITLYDNGTDVWEVGGGDYGLAGPDQAGPGAPLSGYAGSVEGTVGREAGALDMQGLASGTGYLDLESSEIQGGALPAGTGVVDGVPVTIYKLSLTGLQDPDLTGLTTQQVATIRAADTIIEQSGFAGKTTWVSVDADGYIREERTTYTLSDGSTVTQDTVLSNFGCAGTVVMPGQSGSTAPPAGCVSPDTAGAVGGPTSTTTTPTTSSASGTLSPSPSTAPPTTVPSGVVPAPTPSPSNGAQVVLQGNGIGSVHFGDAEYSAIAALDTELGGPPTKATPEPGNCGTDDAEQWANIVASFDAGTFVGYSTLAVNGEALPVGSLTTAQGLRVGDTLAQAQKIYGAALTTSLAQGGSWSVSTPDGKLDGYLNGVPDQVTPAPTIMSIEAGSVGCPAATP